MADILIVCPESRQKIGNRIIGHAEIIEAQLKKRLTIRPMDSEPVVPNITMLLVSDNSGKEEIDDLFKQIDMPADLVVFMNTATVWAISRLEIRYANAYKTATTILYHPRRPDETYQVIADIETHMLSLLTEGSVAKAMEMIAGEVMTTAAGHIPEEAYGTPAD